MKSAPYSTSENEQQEYQLQRLSFTLAPVLKAVQEREEFFRLYEALQGSVSGDADTIDDDLAEALEAARQ